MDIIEKENIILEQKEFEEKIKKLIELIKGELITEEFISSKPLEERMRYDKYNEGIKTSINILDSIEGS